MWRIISVSHDMLQVRHVIHSILNVSHSTSPQTLQETEPPKRKIQVARMAASREPLPADSEESDSSALSGVSAEEDENEDEKGSAAEDRGKKGRHFMIFEEEKVEYFTDDVDKHHPLPPPSLLDEDPKEYRKRRALRERAQSILRNRRRREEQREKKKKKKEKERKKDKEMQSKKSSKRERSSSPSSADEKEKKRTKKEKASPAAAAPAAAAPVFNAEMLEQLGKVPLLQHQVQSSQKEVADLKAENEKKERKLQAAQSNLTKARQELAEMKASEATYQHKFSSLVEKISSLDETSKQAVIQLKAARDQQAETIKVLEAELRHTKENLEAAEKENSRLQSELNVALAKVQVHEQFKGVGVTTPMKNA